MSDVIVRDELSIQEQAAWTGIVARYREGMRIAMYQALFDDVRSEWAEFRPGRVASADPRLAFRVAMAQALYDDVRPEWE